MPHSSLCLAVSLLLLLQLSVSVRARSTKSAVPVASGRERLISSSSDKTTKVWTLSNGRCVQSVRGGGYPNTVLMFKRASYALLASESQQPEKSVKIWSLMHNDDTQLIKTLHNESSSIETTIRQVRLVANQFIVREHTNGSMRVFDMQGVLVQTLDHDDNNDGSVLTALAVLSPTQLASGWSSGEIKIWSLNDGSCVRTLKVSPSGGAVKVLCTLRQGDRVASGGADGVVCVWNVEIGECVHELLGHTGPITSLEVVADDAELASGSTDGTIRLWNVRRGGCRRTLINQGGKAALSVGVTALRMVARETLAAGYSDGAIKVWTVVDGRSGRTMRGHSGAVLSLEFVAS